MTSWMSLRHGPRLCSNRKSLTPRKMMLLLQTLKVRRPRSKKKTLQNLCWRRKLHWSNNKSRQNLKRSCPLSQSSQKSCRSSQWWKRRSRQRSSHPQNYRGSCRRRSQSLLGCRRSHWALLVRSWRWITKESWTRWGQSTMNKLPRWRSSHKSWQAARSCNNSWMPPSRSASMRLRRTPRMAMWRVLLFSRSPASSRRSKARCVQIGKNS